MQSGSLRFIRFPVRSRGYTGVVMTVYQRHFTPGPHDFGVVYGPRSFALRQPAILKECL